MMSRKSSIEVLQKMLETDNLIFSKREAIKRVVADIQLLQHQEDRHKAYHEAYKNLTKEDWDKLNKLISGK